MLPNDHALFRSIFRTASVGMVTADPEQRLKHCNLALCAMLGYGHEEIIGLRLADVVAPEDIARIEPELFQSTGEQASHSTWRFRRKDGSIFPGAVLSCKLPDGFMQAIVVSATEFNQPETICSAQENKDRYFSKLEKQLREALTAREAIRAACEAIGQELGAVIVGIGEFHPDGKHTIVDNAWSATGDLTLLLGRHGQFDAGRIARHLTSGVAAVEDVLTDHRLAGDEGTQAAYKAVGARSSIAVPLTREGRPWAVLFVADKTPRTWTDAEIALAQETLDRVWHAVERARAEEDLRLTAERFQLALKSSPITILCQDLDLRHTWVYNTCFPPETLIGKTESRVFERAEDASASEAINREAMRSGKSQRGELAVRACGTDRYYDLLADPLRDRDGNIAGVTCAVIDITAQKIADAALRESRERQSFLLALNDALRQLSDPAEIMATASRLLGSRLAAGQVAYADIDEAGKHAVISREWNDGTIPIKAAVYGIENFSALLQDLKRGQTILISDVRTDCVIPSEKLEGLKRASIRALLNVPLVKDDRLVAVLAVHVPTSRAWTPDEVILAQEVAERTWEAVQRARAEQALREREELLRFSLRGAGAGAWQRDILAKDLVWSPECYGLHGLDPKLGKPGYEEWFKCLHPDDRASVENASFDALMRGAREYKTEYRVVLPSGEVRWLTALGKVDYATDGTPMRLSGINLDITERKRAEEALLESEERLRFSLKGAGAGAWQWDFVKQQRIWSPESYELHGLDPRLGPPSRQEWFNCLHPEDREKVKQATVEAIGKKISEYRAEYRVVLPSGEVRWLDALGKVDYAADGTPVRMSGINLDITARKRTEEALHESEAWLRLALKGSGAGAWQWDIARNRVLASPESYELFGGAARFGEAITFGDWLQCLHPEDRTPIERAVYDAFEEKSPEFRAEYRVVLPSGEVRWLDGVGKVDYAANGTPVRISGITADISKRKQAEDALRKSEESLRLALKGSGAGAWQWNISTNEMLASLEGYEIHGRADLFGKPTTYEDWAECLHPEDRATAEKVVTDAIEKRSPEYTNEYRVVLPSGGVRWVGVLGKVDYAADGTPLRMLGITTDISKRKQAEDALRDSEKRLKFALEAAGAGTWEVALATGELAASDRTLSLLGIPPGSPATFEETLACVHPEDRPRIEAALHHTLETGEPYRLEWRVPLPDGSVLWRESRAERRSISGKQVVAGLVLDITDRKRAEEALRESQERLQFALEAANAGTWEGVPETGEFTASDRALALHGLPPGTLMTQENAVAAVHPDDRPRVTEALRHTLETGKPYRIELRMPLPDGSTRWIEACGEPRFVSGRRVISGLLQDITERKHAEIALRENEEILRAIIEHVPAPILLSREDRKILRINPALTALTGYTAADIPTRDEWEQFAYREHAQEMRDTLNIAFECSIPLDRADLCVYTKSGEKRIWSVRTAPAGRDSSGQRLFVSIALDITERRKSAEEARISRSRLEAALASMTDAVFISDTKGRFTHFNEAFATFHRFKSKDECATKLGDYPALADLCLPNGELVPLEEWPVPRALRGETGRQAEYMIKRQDGETYVASCSYAPIRNSSGDITGAVVTARDITDKKRAENRLRESEARLSSIIDTAADSIMVLDEKGMIQSANPATLGILGYSAEDLIGQHISVLMPPHIQADHDSYLARFSGSSTLKEVEARRKNGSTIPLDVAVAEWRDGEGRRFFTGILRDLSERKYNEEVLANARRLEAVGQLAGGVAHDFNNLLAVIAGNLELAEDRIADEMTRDLIRRALDAAEKGSSLNRRLLSLARKRMLKPQRLTLNSRVEETAKLLASIVGEHIAVITDLAPDPWVTVADPGEIDSAILNIAANARDAMPNGGRITIATSNATVAAATATKLHRDARPGEYVCLSIVDDGVGMPEEILRKAMDPFFTTKGQGAGTGLGLTSVASFAKQTGGFATVESAPERGCAVSLYLPRSIKNVPPRETGRSEFPRGNGELVLVVEDNDEVREVTLKRIESLGYAVAEARTGPEALQRLQSKGSIHLVLSDIVMPGGMSGYDVARWLASNKPVTKVILCSGYNEGDRLSHTRGSIRDITVLGKPYTREQLAAALKNALAAVHYSHEESSKSVSTGSSKKA